MRDPPTSNGAWHWRAAGKYQDELFTTLIALIGYYVPRAELRRAHELLETLSARIAEGPAVGYPVIASVTGYDRLVGRRLRDRAETFATGAGRSARGRAASAGRRMVDRH